MLHSRAAIYFDEVARRGSIRAASEALHIAPSAVDRQILLLEQRLGVPLFERMPTGLRLTSAGELLVDSVRRWRRDTDRVLSQIDDLRGLRRGKVSSATVEGAGDFFSRSLKAFHAKYTGIEHAILVAGSQAVADAVLSGAAEVGLTFNPPDIAALRVERTLIYQLGVVVRPDHELAGKKHLELMDCLGHSLVVPEDTISLRGIIDQAWHRFVGEPLAITASASSIGVLKSMILAGVGAGLLTEMDVYCEVRSQSLVFIPLADKIPLSVLALVTASGRRLSAPAALMVKEIAAAMMAENAPGL
jgi:DNA-binding transcriptional LysR family regulator